MGIKDTLLVLKRFSSQVQLFCFHFSSRKEISEVNHIQTCIAVVLKSVLPSANGKRPRFESYLSGHKFKSK